MASSDGMYDRVKALIQARHRNSHIRSNEWVVLFELRDGTGWTGRGQRMDAFAMHTWPSKRFHRVGYEIKLSRSDFLRELRQPHKRDWGLSITNEFWFVAPPGVVKIPELPEGCGLLLVTSDGDGLKTIQAAKQHHSDDLAMPEIASLLRQAFPQDAFMSVRWRMAGRELTNEDLSKIIDDERDVLDRGRFDVEVRKRVDRIAETTTASLRMYAQALLKAGVSPPDWMMRGWNKWDSGNWEAERWVKDNVTVGPHGASVHRAQLDVASAQQSLVHAQYALERSLPKKKQQQRRRKPRPVV